MKQSTGVNGAALSTGTMLLRNSKWTRQLLDELAEAAKKLGPTGMVSAPNHPEPARCPDLPAQASASRRSDSEKNSALDHQPAEG
jgi:hypothetical protein